MYHKQHGVWDETLLSFRCSIPLQLILPQPDHPFLLILRIFFSATLKTMYAFLYDGGIVSTSP